MADLQSAHRGHVPARRRLGAWLLVVLLWLATLAVPILSLALPVPDGRVRIVLLIGAAAVLIFNTSSIAHAMLNRYQHDKQFIYGLVCTADHSTCAEGKQGERGRKSAKRYDAPMQSKTMQIRRHQRSLLVAIFVTLWRCRSDWGSPARRKRVPATIENPTWGVVAADARAGRTVGETGLR